MAGYLVALAALGPFLSPMVGTLGGETAVGSVGWRFGILGLIFGSQFYLMLALLAGAVSAGLLGHRRMLVALTVVAAVATIGVGIGLPVFALDFFQLRRVTAPAAFQPYRLAAMKAAALALVGIPVFLTVSAASWRAARQLPRDRDLRDREAPMPLVTGHP